MTAFLLWLRRVGAWVMRNPLVGVILALLGAVGLESARRRMAQRKAARAERKATVATVEGKAAVAAARAEALRAEDADAREDIEAARADEAAAAGWQADPHERLKALERKWKR